MGAILEINGENVRLEELNKEAQRVLGFLKENKKSYAINIAILKNAIQILEKERNSKIFQ